MSGEADQVKNPLRGRAYQRARALMGSIIASPEQLMALVNKGQVKVNKLTSVKFSRLLEPLETSYRLIKAYANNEYRDISFEKLGFIVAAILYFVMPFDSIPDFVFALGFTDDAAILAWTFQQMRHELAKFKKWEDDKG